MTMLEAWAVEGIPEIRHGDDLAAVLASHACELRDGDVVAVTSKVVSKAEGRVWRAGSRDDAIDEETIRVVASRGDTRIVETRHGFVAAAAGVDGSNTDPGTFVLLPEDPDRSARRIRAGILGLLGVRVAVVITDTFGRPWREGVVDVAIGAAGLQPLNDLRGHIDSYGNELDVTVVATADQLAAATELVRGKLGGRPVAVVRGLKELVTEDDGPGAASLIRRPADDLFRLGTAEAMRAAVIMRRTTTDFAPRPVDTQLVRRALAAAITAPAPHNTTPWRFVVLSTSEKRAALFDAMDAAWATELGDDGFAETHVQQRTRRGAMLRRAPLVVVPCLHADGMHAYPDERRAQAERATFLLSMGASIENLLIALAVEGLGAAWVSSTVFCSDIAREELQLPRNWWPMGAVAIGHPVNPALSRVPRDSSAFVIEC